MNQKVALAQLEHLGFNTQLAPSGKEALVQVSLFSYPIILMDCELPDLRGEEVTRQVRLLEAAQNRTPAYIIALTAHASEEHRTECLSVGMDDYISKPMRVETLRVVLNKAQEINNAANSADPAPIETSLHPQDDFTLDPTILGELKTLAFDSSGATILDLINLFFEDSPPIFEKLLLAVENRDLPAIIHCSHKLSGSSSLFGATLFSELCRTVENEARESHVEAVIHLLPRVKIGFEQTLIQLTDVKLSYSA